MLISGEAGIGKSRLVHALLGQIAGESHVQFDCQCSALHAGSAFHPVIAQIERSAHVSVKDSPELRVKKLRDHLEQSVSSDDFIVLAALLSLPVDEQLSEIEPDPERRRRRIFTALLHQLEGATRSRPFVCMFEDMHWSDPSTRELVDWLVHSIPFRPVLVLVTGRLEFAAAWTSLAHGTLLALSRISARNTEEMILHMAAGKGVSHELVRQIVTRADGIPLFIEELTRATLETSPDLPGRAASGRSVIDVTTVPATLHDSLMARLDRFPGIREVAQVGAVIGRSFDYRLLATVVERDEETLTAALAKLEDSGLVMRRGDPPDSELLLPARPHSGCRLWIAFACAATAAPPCRCRGPGTVLTLHFGNRPGASRPPLCTGWSGKRGRPVPPEGG